MPGQRSTVLLGGILVCLSGTSFAGPETVLPEHSQVWGDPEESEEAAEGWTWFGMGYENRIRSEDRSIGQAVDLQGEADGGSRGEGRGGGRHGRSGRN